MNRKEIMINCAKAIIKQAKIPAILGPNKTGKDLIPVLVSPTMALKSLSVMIPKAPNAYIAATNMICGLGKPDVNIATPVNHGSPS